MKLIEELKQSGALKNEMFEKQKIAKENFEIAKKAYNEHTSTVTRQRENLKFFSVEEADEEIG